LKDSVPDVGQAKGMTAQLALLLAQDGIANGAIYVLVALGIVLTFLVTRVIFVPFGDLVAYAALTLASLEQGRRPGTIGLVLILALAAFLFEAATLLRARAPHLLPRAVLLWLVLPSLPVLLAWLVAGRAVPDGVLVAVSLALVLPMGPLLYRIAFRPIADAPVLMLLIVAVVLHFAISGVALMVFGPEGDRPRPLVNGTIEAGGLVFTGQSLLMLGASAGTTLLLWAFFGHTLAGKALRATAVNRVGARLMGIRPAVTGSIAFLLASLLAGVAGILIGPINTLAYDSGFIIGLKGFVGAIIGGMVSYPGAVLGALLVGLLESFTAFWASAFKEVVVFGLLVPVLVLRSLLTPAHEEAEDDP
jgi:branched-chain amino acid transport system permease protein